MNAPDKNKSAERTLAALRGEIDAIDDEMHRLLLQRADLVCQVAGAKAREGGKAAPLFRPGREAAILRRLLARNRKPLPAELVVRVWREIIARLTTLQGPFTVSVLAPPKAPACLDLAREHFGATTVQPVVALPALLAGLKRGKIGIAVVPMPAQSGAGQWWRELPANVQILARLPFLPAGKKAPSALVIGAQSFEPTDDDVLYVEVASEKKLSPATLKKTFGAAGLAGATVTAIAKRGRQHIALVEGVATDSETSARLASALGGGGAVRLLGGYARIGAAGSAEIRTAPVPRPGIMSISPYVAGKSELEGHAVTIKLSSNESALGPSPRAVEAIQKLAGKVHRYPDGGSEDLRDAIGKRFGLAADRIVCGTGSDELIGLLCRAYAGPGDEILYTEHGFSMYPILALSAGATPITAPEKGYRTDVDALIARAGPTTKICFIANPNNPTGTYIPESEMQRLRDGLPKGCLLVIDSAYAEYVSKNDYSAGVEMVDKRDDTVMLRTFSKIFALGGMRIGWGYFPPAIADVLNRIRGTFNIASISQAAAIAALEDTAFFERSRAHNDQWLPWFEGELKKLGLTYVPSVANFSLIEFPATGDKTARKAEAHLHSKGIIPRGVTGYGLPNHLRVTIGTEPELRAVVDALTEFMR